MTGKTLTTVAAACAQPQGPLARKVLDFLTVMERVVNSDKEPAVTPAAWAPLGELLDTAAFFRVGNYGEQVGWEEYAELLTRWANSAWWRCYIWRIHELPGFAVLEAEERSNSAGPVTEAGPYHTLDSCCVYEFDEAGKVRGLYVYDQRPL